MHFRPKNAAHRQRPSRGCLALPARLCWLLLLTFCLGQGRFARAGAGDVPADGKVEAGDRDSVYYDMALLTEALLLVKEHYVSEQTYRRLIYGAINGMLQSLDPYSSFLDADSYKALREETKGQFGGIGVHVGIRHGRLRVIAPIEGSPAFVAGLLPGDTIRRIDGEDTTGMSLERASGLLRGELGTSVTLQVLRGDDEPFDVVIERDDIQVSSVRGACLPVKDGIGYVRLTRFIETTAGDLDKTLAQLSRQGMKALVLDLRSNPGGLMSAALEVANLLLPAGTLIVSTRGRDGEAEIEQRRTEGSGAHAGLPVAVLVNRGSASAAEIIAGALQDNRCGLVVGETTFGKASVQNVVRLRAGPENAVRLTTGFYHTPSGNMIEGKGIVPDLPVEMEPEQWRRVQRLRLRREQPDWLSGEDAPEGDDMQEDNQLQAALGALRSVLFFNQPLRAGNGKP